MRFACVAVFRPLVPARAEELGVRSVSKRCVLCGKDPASGHAVSHSNIKNLRRFEPNLQTVRLEVDGVTRRVRICTRCLRTSRKHAG